MELGGFDEGFLAPSKGKVSDLAMEIVEYLTKIFLRIIFEIVWLRIQGICDYINDSG